MSNTVFPKTVKSFTVINDRLFEDDALYPAPVCLEGENKTLEICVNLDEVWSALGCQLELEHSSGVTDVGGTVDGGAIRYTVPSELMKSGAIRFHLRGVSEEKVRKTADAEVIINYSFDASGELPEFEPSAYDDIMANFTALFERVATAEENVETLAADMAENTKNYERLLADRDFVTSAVLKSTPVTRLDNAFEGSEITELPSLDLSKVESLAYSFRSCASLLSVPDLDLSSCTTLYECFHHCTTLERVGRLTTPNVRKMYALFRNCNALETIEEIDLSSADSINLIFANCRKLQHITFAGSINLSIDFRSTAATAETLMSAINALCENGEGKTLFLGSAHAAKLTEEQIKIATDKGWTVE